MKLREQLIRSGEYFVSPRRYTSFPTLTSFSRMGPLVLGCQDHGLLLDGKRIQFPELPFALVPYIVDWFMYRRYAGAWRFCPSTFHGQPRDTPFFGRKRNGPLEPDLAAKITRWNKTRTGLLYVFMPILILILFVSYNGTEFLRLSSRWKSSTTFTSSLRALLVPSD